MEKRQVQGHVVPRSRLLEGVYT